MREKKEMVDHVNTNRRQCIWGRRDDFEPLKSRYKRLDSPVISINNYPKTKKIGEFSLPNNQTWPWFEHVLRVKGQNLTETDHVKQVTRSKIMLRLFTIENFQRKLIHSQGACSQFKLQFQVSDGFHENML